jgi:ubiquinone/menaquinone biosynthesis C-methylase UbiE
MGAFGAEIGAMRDKRFHGQAGMLRSPERVALLEVERVVALGLEGLPVETVLDVGTGSGVFAEAFAGQALRVTGIDGSAEMTAIARSLVPGAIFVLGEAEKLPFADRSFDLVFLGHLLHETDRPLAALAEARRVARMRVAVLEWPYVEEEHGPPLSHRLAPDAIAELAERAGFVRRERIGLRHMDLYRLEVS